MRSQHGSCPVVLFPHLKVRLSNVSVHVLAHNLWAERFLELSMIILYGILLLSLPGLHGQETLPPNKFQTRLPMQGGA